MADNKKSVVYDESSVQKLGLINGIRLRPSTFVNKLGKDGVIKLAFELIQNANDEASNGYGTSYKVIVNSKIPEITVIDNGRGIPIGSIEDLLEDIYSGSKYDENIYQDHSGSNGMGLAVTQILSDYLELEIHRDGKVCKARYERGYKKYKTVEEEKNQKRTGTTVRCKPDLSIFFGPRSGFTDNGDYISESYMCDMLSGLAVNNPGLLIELEFDKKPYKFLFTGTLSNYLNIKGKSTGIKFLTNEFCEIEERETPPIEGRNFYIKSCVAFSKEGNRTWSYMNNFPTVEHGKHVDGVRAGVSRAITQYIKDHDYIPKNSKFNVSGADIIDNLVCIVMGKMSNPLYDGQTKNNLTSQDFYDYVAPIAYKQFMIWANKNKEEMDKICKMAVLRAKAAYAAKEARANTMNQQSSMKNVVSSKLNFKNFNDCSGSNPEENELFLCEGLSASSSLVMSRDSKTQAYLALRGKVLNITGKTNPKLSEELIVLNTILGLKFKPDGKIDFNKLRYHKIFIMTDADPDGSHIASLLLGYFLAYAPELITEGHVYVVNPPFYVLQYGKDLKLNILNETYFEIYKKEITLKTMDLIDAKGKKINDNVFKVFLNKLVGLTEFLELYGKELNIDTDLLELVIRSFDDLIKGRHKQFEVYGFKVNCVKKDKKYRIYHFDRGFEHYYLKIDSQFYKEIYVPIYKRLSSIYLGNVRFKNKRTGEIYSGTLNYLSKCMNTMLIGKKTTTLRMKGLGEMRSDLLRETGMDPKTRKVVKVTIDSFPEAKKWAGILLGRDDPNIKKDLFSK